MQILLFVIFVMFVSAIIPYSYADLINSYDFAAGGYNNATSTTYTLTTATLGDSITGIITSDSYSIIAGFVPTTSIGLISTDSLGDSDITYEDGAIIAIVIPDSVAVPSLDYGSMLVSSVLTNTVPLTKSLNITSNFATFDVSVSIFANTILSGPTSWNGTLALPQNLASSSVTAPNGGTVSKVIEIGFGGNNIDLSQPVRISFDSSSEESTAFAINGVTSNITTTCDADDLDAVTAQLLANQECTISNGVDRIIWTRHFTSFFTYNVSISNGNGNGSGSGSAESIPPSLTTSFGQGTKTIFINGIGITP